jgi:hypothetical protein
MQLALVVAVVAAMIAALADAQASVPATWYIINTTGRINPIQTQALRNCLVGFIGVAGSDAEIVSVPAQPQYNPACNCYAFSFKFTDANYRAEQNFLSVSLSTDSNRTQLRERCYSATTPNFYIASIEVTPDPTVSTAAPGGGASSLVPGVPNMISFIVIGAVGLIILVIVGCVIRSYLRSQDEPAAGSSATKRFDPQRGAAELQYERAAVGTTELSAS